MTACLGRTSPVSPSRASAALCVCISDDLAGQSFAMFSLWALSLLLALVRPCFSYVDVGRPPKLQELSSPHPVPRPYRAPAGLTFSTAPRSTALVQATFF